MPSSRLPSGFVSAFSAISAQLACPVCHGDLRMEGDRIICTQCGRSYPIIDGIPVLIPDAATKP